jgi:hypothetical protein
VNRAIENVFFESLDVVEAVDDGIETVLEGTLLVRNITYQKTVMVRYTLDEWETVNDVWAWYAVAETNGWDRFKFSVSLDQGLENRVMWFVAKYDGQGQGNGGECVEWWDNNGGRNYRVGFRKVEEKMYKRGVTVSAPTTPTGPKLSSPQISASTSFPFSAQQERERLQHQAALTQTTLARLKKLNLKNYAAPSGYTYNNGQTTTPPELKFTNPTPTAPAFVVDPSPPTSPTTTTSTDSTPVQTPTPDDEEDDKLTWSLCLENGQYATTLMPSSSPPPSSSTTPIASPIPVSIPPTYPSEMGTSPPFSDLGGGGRGSVYWDWGSRLRGGELSTSGGLMPPQRKRECESPSSSSSGSGNDSNPIVPPTTTTTTTPPPLKQKPTPPKLNLPPSTFSSPTASPSHVQSPNPSRPHRHRRYYHQQPRSHSPPPAGGGDSDAIYEALVREWCFAQGPAASGEMKPKVQVAAGAGGGGGGNLMQSVEG